MKKLFLSMAIAAFAFSPLMAQNPCPGAPCNGCGCPAECDPTLCSPSGCEVPDYDNPGAVPADRGERFRCVVPVPPSLRNPLARLNLTDDQKAQLEKLDAKQEKKVKKYREDTARKRARLEEDYDKQLRKILTPEQFAKYKEARPVIRRRGPGHRRRGTNGCVSRPQPGPKERPLYKNNQ